MTGIPPIARFRRRWRMCSTPWPGRKAHYSGMPLVGQTGRGEAGVPCAIFRSRRSEGNRHGQRTDQVPVVAVRSQKVFLKTMPDDNSAESHQLPPDEAAFVAYNLRGIRKAIIRFIGDDPFLEQAIISTCLALNVSVQTERLGGMAPFPNRRFSFQYAKDTAILTVSPTGALMG